MIDDVLVRARARLGQRRAVVDARAGERRRSPARRAGGRRRRRRRARSSRSASPPPVSSTIRPAPSTRSADRVLDRQQLGAEPARLVGRAAREVGAARARSGSRGSSRSGSTVPAWPPGASRSTMHRAQPLGRAVDRGGEAGGAAADDHEVVVLGGRLRRRRRAARRARARSGARAPCRPRAARPAAARRRRRRPCSSSRASPSRSTSSQRAGTRLRARKSRRSCESRREAVADHAHAAGLERRAGLPRRQQVLDDRVELLLGRVPRLEQVVVELDLVDRLDRRLGVGVGGQQHALGVRARACAPRPGTRCPAMPRHALVGDQQRDLLAARRRAPSARPAPRAPESARTIR